MKLNNTMKLKLLFATLTTIALIAPVAANTTPVVESISVAPSSPEAGEDVTISLTADAPTDINDLMEAEFKVGGKEETVVCSNPYTCEEAGFTTQLDEGDYTAEVRIRDENYATSSWEEKEFTVSDSDGGYYGPTYELLDVGSTQFRLSKGDSAQIQADVKNHGDYSAELEVKWFAERNGKETRVASETEWIDAGKEGTLARRVSWYEFQREIDRQKRYDLKAKLYHNGEKIGEKSGGYIYLESDKVSISEASAEHKENGRVEFSLTLNQDVGDFSCRVSENSDITTFDSPVMEKESGSDRKFSDISYFTDGSYTRYLGCLNEDNEQATDAEKVTFRVETDTSKTGFKDYGPTGTVSSGNVQLFVELAENPERGWCKWERGSSADKNSELMAKPDPDTARWTDNVDFEEGTHTVTYQCFNHDGAITGEKTISFTAEKAEEGGEDDKDTDETGGPEAFFTVSNSNPLKNEPVRFDASGTEGNILEYRWSFEDQTSRFGETIFRSFSETGEQEVTLRVTEYDGDQDSFSRTLDVRGREECRIHVGGLRFEDINLDAGQTTEARISVSNTGSDQDVNVKMFKNGEKVLNRDDRIDRGDEKTFKGDVTASEDANVKAEVRTSGEPCGSQLFQRTKTLEVGDVEERESPTADLDIDPSDADTSEEIEFDATDSSDPDGEIEEYEFDLDGDNDYEITTDEGEVEKSFVQKVDTRATVRVTDDDGYTDTESESYRVEAKNRVSFSNVQAPDKVCSGESFDVTMDVENIGDDERLVILEGEGFGDTQSHSTLLEEDEQETVSITFSPSSTGTKEYRIESAGGNSDRVSQSINVLECQDAVTGATDISMNVIPSRVRAGEPVKVSGYVDDTRGPQGVTIEMGERLISEIETEPDGYYQTYINPERIGKFSLTASSGDRTASRSLEVLPTVEVVSVNAPEKIFQSETFDVCGRVESQATPLIVLMKNGERMDSRYDSGEVCFEAEPSEVGETEYEIMALARGARSTAGTNVEVMESRPEASSFPEKIASVESGDGIVKATIYNNNDDQKKYNVGISGLPDTWTSTSEKEVILQPGEEREVFFYLTPQEEGRQAAFITITSDRSIVYTDSVEVITGGTSEPREKSLLERLRDAFPW